MLKTVFALVVYLGTVGWLGYFQGYERRNFTVGKWPIDALLGVVFSALTGILYAIDLQGVASLCGLIAIAGASNTVHTFTAGLGHRAGGHHLPVVYDPKLHGPKPTKKDE